MVATVKYSNVARDWVEGMVSRDLVKVEPDLIGRIQGSLEDEADVRAGTRLLSTAAVPFEGAAIGCVTASLYESTDVEDRGGIVIRLTTRNDASAFLPHSIAIKDGIELHFAGEEEAEAVRQALIQVLMKSMFLPTMLLRKNS